MGKEQRNNGHFFAGSNTLVALSSTLGFATVAGVGFFLGPASFLVLGIARGVGIGLISGVKEEPLLGKGQYKRDIKAKNLAWIAGAIVTAQLPIFGAAGLLPIAGAIAVGVGVGLFTRSFTMSLNGFRKNFMRGLRGEKSEFDQKTEEHLQKISARQNKI